MRFEMVVPLRAKVVLRCEPRSRKLQTTLMGASITLHHFLRSQSLVLLHVEKVVDLAVAMLAPMSLIMVWVMSRASRSVLAWATRFGQNEHIVGQSSSAGSALSNLINPNQQEQSNDGHI